MTIASFQDDNFERRLKKLREQALNVATGPYDSRSCRFFVIGELWWVDPCGWRYLSGWSNNPTPHPGLVLRSRVARPDQTVHMAPGTSQRKADHAHIFSPRHAYEAPSGQFDCGSYLLNLSRHVKARHINYGRKAMLAVADIEKLKSRLTGLG